MMNYIEIKKEMETVGKQSPIVVSGYIAGINNIGQQVQARLVGIYMDIPLIKQLIQEEITPIKSHLERIERKLEAGQIKGIKNLFITKESLNEIWDEGDDTL